MDTEPAKARILVVEDSATQREHLVSFLEGRGYQVDAVPGGLAALRAIKTALPDVIILDVMLDDLDGYSVCRWVRLSEATRDVVVIMLTAKHGVKERVEGLHVGADDYLPKPYDDDELDARIFAALRSRTSRAALRQRNEELENMLRRTETLAMTDGLTGLFNRRRFGDLLQREWATARRYGHALSCAIVDVDYFKVVNDVAGHSAGDSVLKRLALILTASIREVDVCARYGGDEYALLFPHTPRDKVVVAMERAQQKLAVERKSWGAPMDGVGLSIGIASTEDRDLRTPDDLLEAADRALYEAKRGGRGRINIARNGILAGS